MADFKSNDDWKCLTPRSSSWPLPGCQGVFIDKEGHFAVIGKLVTEEHPLKSQVGKGEALVYVEDVIFRDAIKNFNEMGSDI